MSRRVFLSSSSHSEGATPLSFEKCCLTTMQCSGHQINAEFSYQDERLLLYPSDQGVRLMHPPGCPCRSLTASDIANIPENILSQGVKPAVAVLLQSSDGYVLLTRRAQHMRTFPCVWVPPGGHMEPGETLKQALLRELSEETGLTFSKESLEISTLGLWESVFPPVLSIGLPVRHHIVVYYQAKAKEDRQTLQKKLILDKDELDASAWVDHATIVEVVQSDDFGQSRPVPQRYIKLVA
ncbi:nucleoside diphosphate-linked moiety X motif 17-like isoform X2 [Pocillopora damicornis]|uniref:nucleoside diphosphate-linked moiety X motif 17-like isoform X2 n=1 Tax=Pocillopora damicornis TaxID=46731 RepID=UPI000F559A8E|nr:nucleoside diphosphate-linked moiety X motif 17-like isoform X2 [Pocillopora damicornis]